MRLILAILVLSTASCTNLDQGHPATRAEWMQHYDEQFILEQLEQDSLGKIVPK